MFIRDEAFVFSAGHGEERIETMLEVLAGVQCEPSEDFTALEKLVLRYRDDLTACICIFTDWCEQRRDTVVRLQRAGMELRVFIICKNREEAETMQGLYPPPTPVTWLRTNHIEQDLQQNIT